MSNQKFTNINNISTLSIHYYEIVDVIVYNDAYETFF